MTSVLSRNEDYNPFSQILTHGVSEDSKTVASNLKKIECRQSEPVSLAHYAVLLQNIEEIRASCSDSNWNGYDAQPLGREAVHAAKRFIKNLPYSAPIPMVEPEPIGYFAFIWERDNGIIFSVTATMDRLYYAGLLGDKKINGQSSNGTQSDETIVSIIKKYFC